MERDRPGRRQAHFETAPFDRSGTSPGRSGEGGRSAAGAHASTPARPEKCDPSRRPRLRPDAGPRLLPDADRLGNGKRCPLRSPGAPDGAGAAARGTRCGAWGRARAYFCRRKTAFLEICQARGSVAPGRPSPAAGAHCASPSHRASLLGRAVKWRGNGQKSDGIPLNGARLGRPFPNTRRTPSPAFRDWGRSARLGALRRKYGSRRYGTPRAGAHRR